jgi:hypothetical protein
MAEENPILDAVTKVAQESGLRAAKPDVDILVITHEINRRLYYKLSELLGAGKRGKDEALVFLNTHGGDPHAAFRIARCLRFHYKKVRLAVPHMCKSAGTLIAIGADTVAIGDRGELGPLDVQISNRKEIFENSSGLDYTEALTSMVEHARSTFRDNIIDIRAGAQMSTKMAGEFASQLAIGSVAPMYAQIDPIQVGEVYRAMKIAHEYGRRLNDQTDQLRPEAILKLVSGYPDHSFVIDRKEAESLFRSVEALTSQEAHFANTLWLLFKGEAKQCLLIEAGSAAGDEDGTDTEARDEKREGKPGGLDSTVGQGGNPDGRGGGASAAAESAGHGADSSVDDGPAATAESL